MDSKSRLVLPLEIRDSLGLNKNDSRVILKLFKDNDSLLLKFEKPSLDTNVTLCSKNVSFFWKSLYDLDGLVVRIEDCGSSDPGPNPGPGPLWGFEESSNPFGFFLDQ